jgi:predicted outer membrane repeat protein
MKQQNRPSMCVMCFRPTRFLRRFLRRMPLSAVLLFAVYAHAAVIYVDTDATGSADGSSWTDAYTNLQDAIDDAASGDEIWVAAGTYKPCADGTGDRNPANARTKTFKLVAGSGLYGGFAATETQLSQRDWDTNVTILSGDIGLADDISDNCYNVVFAQAGVILDGFTVKLGNANGTSGTSNARGGGFFTSGYTVTVANCIFTDNRAEEGGAVFEQSGSNCSYTDCTFNANQASADGGGFLCRDSSPTLDGCTFNSNTAADDAGALGIVISSNPAVVDCTFTGNTATDKGGAVFVQVSSSPIFSGCLFDGNDTGNDGGALWNNVGTASVLVDCNFIDNNADVDGGAVSNNDAETVFQSCRFIGNTAGDDGGAANDETGNGSLYVNCVFSGNSAGDYSGGIHINNTAASVVQGCVLAGNQSVNDGAGIGIWEQASAVLDSCTFQGNSTSDDGGALYLKDGTAVSENCIIWGNTAYDTADQIFLSYTSYGTFRYCDIEGGINGAEVYVGANSTLTDGGGNINSDPEYFKTADADGADNVYGTDDDGLRILAYSPCRNAGSNALLPADETDLDGDDNYTEALPLDVRGDARVQDSTVDIGAYEVAADADSDGDGLPDTWENTYGLDARDDGSVNADNGASGDPDSDGVSNLTEYLQGRNPAAGAVADSGGVVDLEVFAVY